MAVGMAICIAVEALGPEGVGDELGGSHGDDVNCRQGEKCGEAWAAGPSRERAERQLHMKCMPGVGRLGSGSLYQTQLC